MTGLYIIERTCTKCQRTLPLSEFYVNKQQKFGRNSRCKDCVRQYTREHREQIRNIQRRWREKNPDYSKNYWAKPENKAKLASIHAEARKSQPEKAKARDVIHNETRRGRMTSLPCKFCGDPNTEAHHPDYSRPKDVIWVCRSCHREHFHNKPSEAPK